MSQKNNNKFQKKLSELEKFITGLLDSPMNPRVKKEILDDLQSYKAKLLAGKNDSARNIKVRKKVSAPPDESSG